MGSANPFWRSTALIPQMIMISRRERLTNTSRSFGCRKFPEAEVLLRAKSAARNPFVLSLQQERVQRRIDPMPTASPNPAAQLGTPTRRSVYARPESEHFSVYLSSCFRNSIFNPRCSSGPAKFVSVRGNLSARGGFVVRSLRGFRE